MITHGASEAYTVPLSAVNGVSRLTETTQTSNGQAQPITFEESNLKVSKVPTHHSNNLRSHHILLPKPISTSPFNVHLHPH